MTVLLTILMLLITLFLNFTRCTFIDIFVGMAFFSKIYIEKSFNVLYATKLIGILVLSIVIDVLWEVLRLYHFTFRY